MKTAMLMAVILLTSCVSMKYTVTPMTMTVKGGKPTFKPIGNTQLLQDTTIDIFLIQKRRQ